MEINNSIPIKTYYFIRTICIIAIAVLLIIPFLEIYNTKDYKAVSATISNITREVDLGVENDSKKSIYKFIEYQYDINGTEYLAKQRTFFAIGKSIGDTKKIHYSEENPTNIRNLFKFEVCGFAFLLATAFLIVVCKMISVKRKNEEQEKI